MPCIIHWNFNHFVVLEGIDGDRASINDPAMGRRERRHGGARPRLHRRRARHGADRGFRKIGSKPQGLRLLLRELRASRGAVALVIAVSLALIVPGIVIPGFSKVFVDEVLIQNNQQLARPAADRHGHHGPVPHGRDGAAAVAPAAAADQARRGHDQPLSLARDVAADGLLRPAPRRRHRQPRRHQRADRAPALGRRRHQRAQPHLGRVLRRRDGVLRCPACGHRRRHVADQRRGAEDHLGTPGGPEPKPRARAGQAPRQHGERGARRSKASRRADWRTRPSGNGPAFRPSP